MGDRRDYEQKLNLLMEAAEASDGLLVNDYGENERSNQICDFCICRQKNGNVLILEYQDRREGRRRKLLLTYTNPNESIVTASPEFTLYLVEDGYALDLCLVVHDLMCHKAASPRRILQPQGRELIEVKLGFLNF
ncbi:hypothetical protein E3N88_06320 [Mikania micrantha]|uniref:Uncharacterized protein n=1 Tax=Mikania micrantha TaxID=192012 RepID=A0A5N6PNE9_9ASTR|nr:hypothetical protein E3N88_06320 [Mikania micrantha]